MNNYTNKWNTFFNNWLNNPQETFNNDFLAQQHTGKGKKELLPNYLPQPYLGNPKECSAITLNLNPGTPIDSRSFPNGVLVKKLMSKDNYCTYASEFPQLKTKKISSFWKRQINWINQIGQNRFELDGLLPFAIELCHWHSAQWKEFDYPNAEIKNYLKENVFDVIDAVIGNATIKTVLSIGKTYNTIFEVMGFTKKIEVGPGNFFEHELDFPFNKKGLPANRFYSLWQSPSGTKYLNTYSIGSNRPPSSEWKEIEVYNYPQN